MWQGAMAALRRAVRSFTQDRGLGTEVVYRRIVGMGFDAQSQEVTPTYVDTSVRAIAGQLTKKSGGSAETSLGETTRAFILAQQDLESDPLPGDLIVLGADTYRVRTIVQDLVGARHRIEAELL